MTSKPMVIWGAHLALLAVVAGLYWVVPDYHTTNMARIMVLAIFAAGYNLAFGYTGLLSLGHALFFAAGMYGASLPSWHWGWGGEIALALGPISGALMAGIIALLALRAQGVSFMIVTLMFAQAGFLTLIYYASFTGGDDGFSLPKAARVVWGLNLSKDAPRFWFAFGMLAIVLGATLALVRSRFGRVMVALRENEERCRMLGYNPYRYKWAVMVMSGALSGLAGGLYAILFGYAGASFAQTQYSILPLLYTLVGGAGTIAGPVLGAAVMFVLTEYASAMTSAWLFVVGAVLVVGILFLPQGILGFVRRHLWRDLP